MAAKPFQVEDKADRTSPDRLPLVHLDPGSPRFVDRIARPDHHPLELLRLLPFLELHGAKPTADEFIQLPEDLTEFLDVIVPDPALKVRIELLDDPVSLRGMS